MRLPCLPRPTAAVRPEPRLPRALCLLAAALAVSGSTRAQPADLFAGLPTAAQVRQHFAAGAEGAESLGRQCAALDRLERTFFRDAALMAGPVGKHPATRTRQADYAQAFAQLRADYARTVGNMDSAQQARWSAMCQDGGRNALARPVSQAEVMALPGVPAVWQQVQDRRQQLDARIRAQEAAAQAAQERRRQEAAAAQAAAASRRRAGLFIAAIGAAIGALGLTVFVLALRSNQRLNRYEFEHRTDGGVVQFADFAASVRHDRQRWLANHLMLPAGVLLCLAGTGTVIAGLSN